MTPSGPDHEALQEFGARIMEASLAAARVHPVGVRTPAELAERANEIAVRVLRYTGAQGIDWPDDRLRAAAFKIARNLAVDRIRAKARRHERDESVAADVLASPESDRPPDGAMHIATHVARAIDVLAPEEKDIVFQRVLSGRTTRQIAAISGIPESTVRRRLADAYRILRCYMRKKAELHPDLCEELKQLGYKPND